MATSRKTRGNVARKRRPALQTAEQLFSAPPRLRDGWIKTTQVVTRMRSGNVSLRAAAGEFGIDPRTVARMAGSALRRRPNRRYAASAHDSMLRVMTVPGGDGTVEIAVRDSRHASLIGEYDAAVHRFLATGDATALNSALAKARKSRLKDAGGQPIHLLSDLDELEHLGSAGVLSFQNIYARSE